MFYSAISHLPVRVHLIELPLNPLLLVVGDPAFGQTPAVQAAVLAHDLGRGNFTDVRKPVFSKKLVRFIQKKLNFVQKKKTH